MSKPKDISVIPPGLYCYGKNGLCPYWSSNPAYDEQECGYCSYLEKGDWEAENSVSLLWDQVKECYENYGWDDDDEWNAIAIQKLKNETKENIKT